MSSISIELPQWLYRAVVSGEVLTLDRDYFRLRGGIERRLYELARKHCGKESRWSVGLETLHKKTGSQSPKKAFRHQLLKLVESDHLPGYTMNFDNDADQLIFYNRKGRKAGKAKFDDQMKQLFKPKLKNPQRDMF